MVPLQTQQETSALSCHICLPALWWLWWGTRLRDEPRPAQGSGFRTGSGWSSVTVEPNGVDRGRDGSSAVAPPLLFGLFVSEGFALGELEDVVGLLAPVAVGSSLKQQPSERDQSARGALRMRRCSPRLPNSPLRQTSCLGDGGPRPPVLRLSGGRERLSERQSGFHPVRIRSHPKQPPERVAPFGWL